MSKHYLAKRKSTAVKANYDDRKGLGYGVLEPQFHKPSVQNSNYPYLDADEHEDIEDQVDPDNLDAFVAKTNLGYHITDFMSNKKNDPFFFVAGNTKLGESIAKNSMVPMPNLYKGRQVALGGSTSAHVHVGSSYPSRGANDISYGTKHGYSSAPPPMGMRHEDIPAYKLEDILDDEDDSLVKLRTLIRDIHAEQEDEKNDS